MKHALPAVALVLLFAVAVPAADQPARRTVSLDKSPHNPEDADRLPQATSMAFSPDGRWLAVSYFVAAVNRPGADWDSWVTQWDLQAGRRITVPNAHGPVAISPDSRTLAANTYTRDEADPTRPKLQLALWRLGETEPFQRLPPAEGLKDISDTVFHDDARLLALTVDGFVHSWGPDWTKPPGSRWPLSGLEWSAALWDKTVPPMISLDGPGALFFRGGPLLVLPARGHALARPGLASVEEMDVPPKLPPVIVPMPWALHDVRGIKQFAFQPGALRWGALSGNGKLTIIDSKPAPEPAERPLERVLPGGGAAVAFNADATRVAAADARGIVRIWDVATGRLLRTLRLDDRPADTVLVAAVQCSSVFGDPAANRKALAAYVTQAAKAGAKIVVLPETAVTGYLTSDLKRTWQVDQRPLSPGLEGADPAMAAETVPGSSTEFFSQIADRCGIYLTVPLLEVDRRTGRYYNTVVLLGPDGRTLIHYRKRNPWMWAEQGWVTAGDLGNPVVDTPFGRLGLLVCFDIHEQAAVMAERKIDTLLYSIAWVEEQGSPWFANTLPAIARERGFHIVAANWTVPRGQRPTWFGYGQSRIISKEGGVLARAGKDTDEGVVFAEIPCGDQTGVPPP